MHRKLRLQRIQVGRDQIKIMLLVFYIIFFQLALCGLWSVVEKKLTFVLELALVPAHWPIATSSVGMCD